MMSETMGQIIRRLRKDADLTQEELAEMIGVTYQAVSRWENDTGMPDISQLVPLASVFDIPIDVLFGRVGQNAEEVDDFLAQMLWEDHHHEYAEGETFYDWWVGRYKKHRDMLAKYPNHVLLLYRTMSEGVFAVNNYADERNDEDRSPLTPEEYRTILEECVRWGDRIMRLASKPEEMEYVYGAKTWLILAHTLLGQKEKALEIARTLPENYGNFFYSQKAGIANRTGDRQGEAEARCQAIRKLLEQLDLEAGMLGHIYYDAGHFADARECYLFTAKLTRLLYGDESWTPPFAYEYSFSYGMAALCMYKEGRYEEAIDLLEEFFDRTVRQTEGWNTHLNEPSSSPLLRACKWTYNPEVKCNAKQTLTREILEQNWTKNLRGNPRFDALAKRIEEMPEA